jgi:hypothetical protein
MPKPQETDPRTYVRRLEDKLRRLSEDYSTLLSMGMAEDAYKIAAEIEGIKKEIQTAMRSANQGEQRDSGPLADRST